MSCKQPLRNTVESGTDRAPQHTCSQSAIGGVSTHDERGERKSEQEGDLKKDCRKRDG